MFARPVLRRPSLSVDGQAIQYESPMELVVFLGVQDPSGVRPSVLSDSFWSEDEDEDARNDRVRKLRYRCSRAFKRSIPDLEGDPIAPLEKQHPVYRRNTAVIESNVHRFLTWSRWAPKTRWPRMRRPRTCIEAICWSVLTCPTTAGSMTAPG
jgi:hypothetical protein